MRSTSPFLRPLAFAVLAIAVLGVSGCKWFKKGNPDYALSAEARPLEVPPDLNLPNTAGAMKLPPAAGQDRRRTGRDRWGHYRQPVAVAGHLRCHL